MGAGTNFAENLPFSANPPYMGGHGKQPFAMETPGMQMQLPELPNRIMIAILIVVIGHAALTVTGGWMLYQSALARVDASAATVIERLEPQIRANGERIDRLGERVERNSVLIARNGERIDRNAELIARNAELIRQNAERIEHNGELITQLRERMTAVEVRVGALEDVVRFFHPPEGASQQES